MTDKATNLVDDYASALAGHLEGAGEAALHRAYEIGRRAIAEGRGVLDVVAVHHEALRRVLAPHGGPSAETARIVLAAESFLIECLSPFEMIHRGVRDANAALRRLNEMLEEGSKRIAHALHDEAGQILASVHLALETLSWDLAPGVRDRIREVRKLLDGIETQLRTLSHELRPTILDDLGLLPAVEFLAKGVAARSGVEVRVDGPVDRRLPRPIETALYRVVQEALTNATRHGRARRIEVTLAGDAGRARCSVVDNGEGFDVATVMARKGALGLGLTGIRERVQALNGELEIDSTPGRGTQLRITIPLEGDDADASSSGR